MRVCNLSYPSCKAHAPYYRLWPVWLYHIFLHYLYISERFSEENIEHKMRVSIFSTTFIWNTFNFKNHHHHHHHHHPLLLLLGAAQGVDEASASHFILSHSLHFLPSFPLISGFFFHCACPGFLRPTSPSLTLSSRRIPWGIIINVLRVSCKVPVILVRY